MWIKWQVWTENGVVDCGEMPVKYVNHWLTEYGRDAAQLLRKTGADHVLYAIKFYNALSGELELIRFYSKPMSDEDFERVALMRDVVVYAIHNHNWLVKG